MKRGFSLKAKKLQWLGAVSFIVVGGLLVSIPTPSYAQLLYLGGGNGGNGVASGAGVNGSGGLIDHIIPPTPNTGQNEVKPVTPHEGLEYNVVRGTDAEDTNGGRGGDVTVKTSKSLTIEKLILEAGDGGAADNGATPTAGKGGYGGAVTFDSATYDITIKDELSIKSGLKGNNGQGGQGGVATFKAKNLIVDRDANVNLVIDKRDGELGFNTKRIDASQGNLTININNTTQWDSTNSTGVALGDVVLGMGHELQINGNGAYSLSGLTIGGIGQNSLTPAKFRSDGNVNFSGKQLSFYLPEDSINGTTLLDNTISGNTITIDNVNVSLGLAGQDLKALKVGDTVHLIEGNVSGSAAQSSTSVNYGAKHWNFGIKTENGDLNATLGDTYFDTNNSGAIATDRYGAVTIDRAMGKAYFQSNAAALNSLNFGADQVAMISDYVLPMNVKKIADPVEGVAFIQGSGFKQRIDTGSHIDNDGYHLMGGAGIRYHQDAGNLLATVFIEHGDGDYDSYNGGIHGKGDVSYTGAGIYLKQSWDNGWFVDGTLRMGKVERDFSSHDMVDGSFGDKKSDYYGFHLGGGKAVSLSDQDQLILNGRLMMTRIEDETIHTRAGEKLAFDEATSLRTHVGARYERLMTSQAKLYAGVAWEQEYDGETGGKLDGYKIDAPDFSGASAVFEVGAKFEQKPGEAGWVANVGLNGVAGTRDAVSGKAGLGYRW